MTPPTYSTTCPKCGGQLAAVALDAQTAPWLCALCALGFWACELSSTARASFRPHHNDWGFGPERAGILTLIDQEIAEAHTRGTSLRDDQFNFVEPSFLSALKARARTNPAFKSLIETQLSNMGPA